MDRPRSTTGARRERRALAVGHRRYRRPAGPARRRYYVARTTLGRLGQQPGITTAGLAAGPPLDKDSLKRRIRTLKEHGLSRSLPTGYELSARGQTYLSTSNLERASPMTEHTIGVPNLIDFQTPDTKIAEQFYAELLGWRFDEADPTGYRYARTHDGAVIAGVRQAAVDDPSVWTLYLSTDDISRTATLATESNGSVLHGPIDIPDQGHVAVIADSTGAVTGFWQPQPGWSFASHVPGAFAWAELLTPDGKVADDFYAQLTGLASTQIGDGDTYDYAVWTPTGHESPVVGRHQIVLPKGVPAHWRIYFTVDPDVGTDQTLANAVSLGATTVAEPSDIPAGRIAVLADPTGAQFALLTPTPHN